MSGLWGRFLILYGMSENGWIDSELYFNWFEKIFVPDFMLEGHKSHNSPEVIANAADLGLNVFCLPPNTSHTTQPLDVSYFGPLKQHMSSTCHKCLSNNPGAIVTKVVFSSLIILKLGIRQLPEDLINSFHKTGVCPLNRMSSVFVSCHHMNRHVIVMIIRLY